MDDIESQILDIIAKEARVERERVIPAATMEDLKIASVDLVQIVFALEVAFDITIPEEALGLDAKNVGEVVEVVKKIVVDSRSGAAGKS